jgi:hypothetical protein
MRSIACVVALAATLSACNSMYQLSSGQSYLDGYDRYARDATTGAEGAAKSGGPGDKSLSAKVRQAATVEPHLIFPARIGLARIEYGRLAPVPPAEADAWLALAGRLSPWLGEFVPVSPLVASFAAAEVAPGEGPADNRDYFRYDTRYDVTDRVVQQIRVGAARQHVDYVLVYEVLGDSSDELTPLSVVDLSIVGAFLIPSRALEATSTANAILIDVRNGYPYGTARAAAEDSRLSPNAGSTDRRRNLFQRTKVAAVADLTTHVETMARDLYAKTQQRAGK